MRKCIFYIHIYLMFRDEWLKRLIQDSIINIINNDRIKTKMKLGINEVVFKYSEESIFFLSRTPQEEF